MNTRLFIICLMSHNTYFTTLYLVRRTYINTHSAPLQPPTRPPSKSFLQTFTFPSSHLFLFLKLRYANDHRSYFKNPYFYPFPTYRTNPEQNGNYEICFFSQQRKILVLFLIKAVILWNRYLAYAQVFGLADELMRSGYHQLIDNVTFQIDSLNDISLSDLHPSAN